jgi:hypothetical protein
MDEARLLELLKQRSQVFDLETGGFNEKRMSLIEGGVYDFKTNKIKRTAFRPGLRDLESWTPFKGKKEFLGSLDPWARSKFDKGGDWHHMLSERPKADPATWLKKNIISPVEQGKWMWAHNARFDLRFVAQNLDPKDYDAFLSSKAGAMLDKSVVGRRGFHTTTGSEAWEFMKLARDPGSAHQSSEMIVKSWPHFMANIEKASQDPAQGLMLDTQYLMQATLAHAKEAGMINPRYDLATGTSVEAYKMAFQREFPGKAHTVAPDITATRHLMEDYIPLIGKIRNKEALLPHETRALRFHEELQPRLFPHNVESEFMKAKMSLLKTGTYELTFGPEGQITSKNFDSILGIYEQHRQKGGYMHVDVSAMHAKVKDMTLDQLEAATLQKDARLQNILKESWEASAGPGTRAFEAHASKAKGASRLFSYIKKNPAKIVGLGLGATIGAMALMPYKSKEKAKPGDAADLIKGRLHPNQYANVIRQLDKNKTMHHRSGGY